MKKVVSTGFICLLLPLTFATAQETAFDLTPGVVVDRAADALYLMRPGGGVERVSISSGNVSWKSEEADKPVAVFGDLLLAQVERPAAASKLHVALLDTRSGRVVEEMSVTLPAGALATVDDALSRNFALEGVLLGDALALDWKHVRRYGKAVAPGPDEPLEEVEDGAYRVDLQASELVAIGSVSASLPSLPASVQSWMAANEISERPVEVGDVLAATQAFGGQTSPAGTIVLKRWDRSSGLPMADLEIFRGPYVLQFRSADGRHLLVAERSSAGEFQEYEWWIFSLESGEEVGRLRHHQAHSSFFVAGRGLVLIERPYSRRVEGEMISEPRRLHAVVLGSGSTLWDRPLRDTSFKGQVPP